MRGIQTSVNADLLLSRTVNKTNQLIFKNIDNTYINDITNTSEKINCFHLPNILLNSHMILRCLMIPVNWTQVKLIVFICIVVLIFWDPKCKYDKRFLQCISKTYDVLKRSMYDRNKWGIRLMNLANADDNLILDQLNGCMQFIFYMCRINDNLYIMWPNRATTSCFVV